MGFYQIRKQQYRANEWENECKHNNNVIWLDEIAAEVNSSKQVNMVIKAVKDKCKVKKMSH